MGIDQGKCVDDLRTLLVSVMACNDVLAASRSTYVYRFTCNGTSWMLQGCFCLVRAGHFRSASAMLPCPCDGYVRYVQVRTGALDGQLRFKQVDAGATDGQLLVDLVFTGAWKSCHRV